MSTFKKITFDQICDNYERLILLLMFDGVSNSINRKYEIWNIDGIVDFEA